MTQTGAAAAVKCDVRTTCSAVAITLLHLKFFFSARLLYIYVLENPLKHFVLLLEF